MFALARRPLRTPPTWRWVLACVLAWAALLGHGLQVAHLLGHVHVFCVEHGQIEHRHHPADAGCGHGCRHHHGAGQQSHGAGQQEHDAGQQTDHDGDHEACAFPDLGLVPDGPCLPTAPLPEPWQDARETLSPSTAAAAPRTPLSYAPSRSPPMA